MRYIGDETRMREVSSVLPIYAKKGALLLDVGAGNGDYKPIAESYGYYYLGIDKNYESSEKRIYKKDIFGAIAFDSKFDCILLIDVLEHIENDSEAINILHGLLNPGGYLLVHTPNKDGTHILCAPEDNKAHVRIGYTANGLSKLLLDAGFKIVKKQSTFNFYDALLWDLFYCLEHNIDLDTKQIKDLCINKVGFVAYGLMILAEKK